VCIYDDAQGMFVTSPGQLGVRRMIEKSLNDMAPIFRMNVQQRDPHFRVYSGGRTYYWSFRNSKFYGFEGQRWTLADRSAQMCAAYRRDPIQVQQAYLEQSGIAVTEANFCCGSG
jgi:hypothetical protein